MRPIRVLHILGKLNRGGAETSIMSVFRHAKEEKLSFDFVVHDPNEGYFESEVHQLGGAIYRCPTFSPSTIFNYRAFWKSFFKKHKGEWDIVHCHIRSTASLILPIARANGFTTIVHSHSTSSGGGVKAKVKDALQLPLRYLSDYYVACSVDAGKWLFGEKIVTSKDFQVIENAVEGEEFYFNQDTRDELRRKLNLDGTFVIGNVSRLIESKNHDFMLDWFSNFRINNADSKLLLVGYGEQQKHLEEKIIELKLEDDVLLIDGQDRIGDYLNAMDVFLFPSKFEGLGIVAIEAQFNGLPVVMSDRIPAEAIVSDDVQVLKLDAPFETWDNAILRSKGKRTEVISSKTQAYEAKKVTKKLAKLYRELASSSE